MLIFTVIYSVANPLTQENPLYFTVGEGDFCGATFAVNDDDKAPLRDNMEVKVSSMDKRPKAARPQATNPSHANDYEELSKI